MQDTNVPLRFSLVWAENAGAGFIRVVPDNSQIGIQDGAASFNDGFVPDNFTPTESGGVPPFGQDFNGVLNVITEWLQWNQAGGPNIYDGTFSAAIGGYPKGALLTSASYGSYWLSLVDNNTVNPDAGPSANWFGFTPGNLYAVDTGAANAGVATITPAPANQSALIGQPIVVKKIPSANNAAYTLNLNAFGALNVLHGDGTQLQSNELPASRPFTVVYDGTAYILQSVANAATMLLPNSVTNAKLAVMPNSTVKGNVSGGTATPQDVPISSIVAGSGVGTVPIGGSFDWWTPNPPSGTVELNGATLSRTTYSVLNSIAASMGYAAPWGPGNGTTTFSIPDTRGAFVRGYDHGRGLDPGRVFGTLQLDAFASHTHTFHNNEDNSGGPGPGHGGGGSDHVNTTDPTGDVETRPVNIAALKVMRYQ